MANIQINQLPTAGAITGQELVPIQQNGVTVQTTTAAISASPSQTQTFLTVGLQTTLPNSRYFSTGAGLGITDGGAQGAYTIAFNGTAASLEASGTGFVVKTAADTITPRSIATSGNGISVTDGDGIAGNPTFQLTGLAQAIANASGTGLLALGSGTTLSPVTLTGTSNQIGVTGGDGSATPTISLANNFIAPGTAGITLPNGTTAQRGATTGQIRYNTDTARFEGYYAGSWQTFGIGDGTITSVSGTTNQIDVTNVGSIATVAIAANPTIPGTAGVVIPVGTTAQRTASPTNGILRYNTTLAQFEAYTNSAWSVLSTGSTGVTSVATGTGLTGGPITSTGTISIANTGATAGTYGSAARTVTQAVNAQGQITSIYDQPIDGIALTTGSISTSPTSANDIANKSYVDGLVATGLTYHQPVQAATTASLASITGGTVTYNNGVAGVGATLTLSVALTVLDGYTLLNTNRILVKNEVNSAYNGIYTWATGGTVLTRATDADTYGTGQNQLSQNDYFFTQNGTVNKGTSYVVTTIGTIVFGTTAIIFAEFSSSLVYTAGTGLTLAGTQFSVTNTAVAAGAYGSATQVGTFTVNAQGQLTLAASTPIAIANTQVSGLGTMSTQDANAVAITGGAISGTSITVADNVFTLQDNIDPSKQAQFQLSGLLTGTTYVYTLPTSGGGASTLVDLNSAQTIAASKTFTGSANIFGSSVNTYSVSLGVGATASGNTKTVNVGTGGLSGSTTNITVGATAGTSTTTMNGQVDLGGTTTSVNFARITGAATGAAPTISAQGSDAHINLNLTTKGVNGAVNLQPNGALTLVVGQSGTGVGNNIAIYPTTNTMNWVLRGPDTNIGYTLQTKGTGNFYYVTGGGQQAVIADTQSAVNYLGITGSITSEAPSIYVAGSDANINLNLTPKGTGSVTINATTAITVPAGTTAQRPTGATGMFRYNSTTAGFEGYNGTVWGAIGGGSNITTLGLWENASVIAANYTIGTGNNATSAGPITINSGVVVTVPSGSTWVVV